MTTTPAKSDAELLYEAIVEVNDKFNHAEAYVSGFNSYSDTKTVIDGQFDLAETAALFLRLRARQEAGQ